MSRQTALPVIDVSAFQCDDESAQLSVAEELGQSVVRTGFVYVKGHGVPESLISDMLRVMREFFELDDREKRRTERKVGTYRGYIPTMPFATQRNRKAPPPIYEAFIVGTELESDEQVPPHSRNLCAPNLWPENPVDFREIAIAYYETVSDAAMRLLKAFAMALEVEPDTFVNQFHRHLSNTSLLHYPARPDAIGQPADDVFPHKDTNTITLLHPGEVGGLQVQNHDGSWIDVTPLPGCLVINIGNLMELWSGGRFHSTLHRVHPPRERDRYAIGHFSVPDYDAVIAPVVPHDPDREFPPIKAGESLAEFISLYDPL